ncbi:hypothetical protein KSF73_04265 [Burkholderiaceae bacterium DAT-1]|nr:hypothetical protein [Burkholderiaceae bacterium DAT-1]
MIRLAPLNHLLAQRSDLRALLSRHAGQSARIQVGLISLSFSIDGDGYLCDTARAPDAIVQISPLLLPRLALGDLQAAQSVRMEGDPALAADLARVLQQLDWDAEADLARLTGDVTANRIVNSLKHWFDSPGKMAGHFAEASAEYLQNEAAILASGAAQHAFAGDVDMLRDDLARIEQRLKNLEDGSVHQA